MAKSKHSNNPAPAHVQASKSAAEELAEAQAELARLRAAAESGEESESESESERAYLSDERTHDKDGRTYVEPAPVRLYHRNLPTHVVFTWADGRTVRVDVEPKQFSTGSVGGYANGKVSLDRSGAQTAQCNLNLTLVRRTESRKGGK